MGYVPDFLSVPIISYQYLQWWWGRLYKHV